MSRIQRQSEKRNSFKNKAKILAVIFFVLISGFFMRNSVARIAHIILVPTKQTFSFIKKPFSNMAEHFQFKSNLVTENFELTERNKRLEIEVLSMKNILDQNQHFKSVLNVYDNNFENRITSKVISIPPFSPFSTFISNVSGFDEPNRLVGNKIFYLNVLIGEVKEVHANNVVGKLYSTNGHKLNVKINNEIVAEAEGIGGLSFKIEIPKSIEVEKNTPIFAIEHDITIIGIVDKIVIPEASSFQTIYFKYPFTYSDLDFVEIAL